VADLSDPEGGRHFIPRLELPRQLELIRPGELTEPARDLTMKVLEALSPTEGQAGVAGGNMGTGVNDVGDMARLSDAFFGSGPSPGLDGEVSAFLSTFGEGELLAAVQGLMPDVPTVEGEPPNFFPGDALFDPNDLPRQPGAPPEERPEHPHGKGEPAPGHPDVVAFGDPNPLPDPGNHQGETAGERERRLKRERKA